MSVQSISDGAGGQTSAADRQQYVAFELGSKFYGVEITSVREIRQWSLATELPNQPYYGLGVLDIRGEVVPVHDLQARFGGPVVEVTDSHVVLIVLIDGKSIGILVDAVSGIIDVSAADMRPVPEGARDAEHETISGLAKHDERMIALIDLSALFRTQEMETA